MICSFVSCNVKDHIFEIQREKRTHRVVTSVFSWNRYLKCHLDGDGPLQRDCVTLGKMLAMGPTPAPPDGDAQRVAPRLQTFSTRCHGKQSLEKLEGRVQLPGTMGLSTFFTHPLASTLSLCFSSS